jgi:hypothetical protein
MTLTAPDPDAGQTDELGELMKDPAWRQMFWEAWESRGLPAAGAAG